MFWMSYNILFRVCTRKISPKLLIISIIGRRYSSYYNCEALKNILNTIPKEIDKNALRKARSEQRVQLQLHGKGKPASEIYLQVLGNGSEGSARSLYVFTDQSKYLFNCSEGTQRLANEYKLKYKYEGLNNLFFTHRSWDNFGGVPGLLLTLQGSSVTQINFHGPEGISKLFAIAKRFLLTNKVHICDKNVAEEEFTDNIMRVKYVPFFGGFRDNTSFKANSQISPSGFEPIDDCDAKVDDRFLRRMTERSDPSIPAKKCEVSDVEENRDISVAYICQPTTKLGELNLEKCFKFGVTSGPLFEQLKDGNDVTLTNGVVITHSDVAFPPEPCPVFIVIECPSEEFLDSLIEKPEFLKHQKDAEDVNDIASVVVHFTPDNVMNNEKYQQWLNRFPLTTQHLFLNEKNNSLSSIAVHKIQHQLNLISENVFPLLKENCSRVTDNIFNLDDRFINPQTLLKYNLRPFNKIDITHVVDADVESFITNCMASQEFSYKLSKLQKHRTKKIKNSKARYPEILFLGTGSNSASEVRNTSAILVHLSNDKSLLLDCAEGTYLQMYRFYGSDAIDDALLKIKAIYISHLHVDHHLGLIGILQKRRKAAIRRGEVLLPVVLFAPEQIMWWLQRYHEMFEPISDDYRLVPNAALMDSPEWKFSEAILKDLELKKMETVYARHCTQAFSLAISHVNNWKLVYSGDTMPTPEIVTIGQDCDLLIHEATMEDEFKSEAEFRRHSTTSQAIKQGQCMNAKFTMLTHFSHRYTRVPKEITATRNNNVGIAFDNLRVSMADLQELPPLVPVIRALFAHEFQDIEIQTNKKLRQVASKDKYGKHISLFPHLSAE